MSFFDESYSTFSRVATTLLVLGSLAATQLVINGFVDAERPTYKWMPAKLVKTVYQPAQTTSGLALTAQGPAVMLGGKTSISQVFFTVPGLFNDRKIYRADVSPETLFEIERDREFNVRVSTYESTGETEVSTTDVIVTKNIKREENAEDHTKAP
ncbi:hypothetical protein FIP36_17315 [Salmonella enterica]|nr:hypothetical protein [Salmonella enterica]